ncbi:MAG TPA: quinone-dependent dihydroorotate dehydrogenase [Verrucomicrobiae bacterium]|jgi:dihydroorotate dehydrogenase|nr:quinone-dependent dihydroorotate dehydrogenase [Verrucomicrobiae bacterium]
MSWFYRHCIRPALFAQDSETIHHRMVRTLGWASRNQLALSALNTLYSAPEMPVELFGLRFPNPVGLAAGMDKSAQAVPAWAAMGFGFAELGAVTWHAQPGNPLPRVFRAVPEEALINRMGFNNPGAEVFAQNLTNWRASGKWPKHPVGINLGKSKVTPLDKAAEDYANSFRVLWPLLDFFVVNVSSPNTPNLRQLQDKSALDEIFAALQEVNAAQARGSNKPKPILVKVAPDLSFEALDEILELVKPRNIAGIVATNTTITRPQTTDTRLQRIYSEAGGLSGKPLRARSTEVIRHLYRQTKGELSIVGVGGIFNASDAWEKICAGASLVQVYSGLVFEGPSIAANVVKGLQKHLDISGISCISHAIGSKN